MSLPEQKKQEFMFDHKSKQDYVNSTLPKYQL